MNIANNEYSTLEMNTNKVFIHKHYKHIMNIVNNQYSTYGMNTTQYNKFFHTTRQNT